MDQPHPIQITSTWEMNRSAVESNSSLDAEKEHAHVYYVFTVGVNALAACLIVVTNALLLLVLSTTRKLRTLPNAFIASLAVADLHMGVAMVVRNFWLMPSTSWVFDDNEFMCVAFSCLLYLCGLESIFSLTLISFDRYMYIIHPFWYERNISKRVVGVLILVSWCFSVPFGCIPLWSNHFTREIGCDALNVIPAVYFVCQEVFFFTAAVVIAVLYGRICRVFVYQRRRSTIATAHLGTSIAKQKRQSTRWTVIKFQMSVCAMFFICWLPLAIMLPIHLLVTPVSDIVNTIVVTLAGLNSGCNFFAFIAMSKDYRDALAAIILRKRPRQSSTIYFNKHFPARKSNNHDQNAAACRNSKAEEDKDGVENINLKQLELDLTFPERDRIFSISNPQLGNGAISSEPILEGTNENGHSIVTNDVER